MKEAYENYSKRFGWTRWEPGYLRVWRSSFVCLPRWVENVENLFLHLSLRIRGRCISCRMRGVHKMDCYHSWTIRDDLRALRLYPRRKHDDG